MAPIHPLLAALMLAATPASPPAAPVAPEAPAALAAPEAAPAAALAEAPPAPSAEAAPVPPSARSRLLLGDWPASEKRITLDFDHLRAREALAKLASEAGWSLSFEERPRGQVDRTFNDVPADEALLAILEDEELVARRDGNTVTIDEAPDAEADADFEPEGDSHRGERVNLGATTRVGEGETVPEAVAIFGDVEVDGTVLKNAVSVGGRVKLGPKAVVRGDVVSVGGGLEVAPGATIGGQRVSVGFSGIQMPAASKPVEAEPSWVAKVTTGFARTVLFWTLFFVLGLFLMALFPSRLRSVGRELQRAPGPCVVVGLVGASAAVPLVILLIVTLVGILALPFLGIAVLAGLWLGMTSLALLLGARFPSRNPARAQVLALALGATLFCLVDLVPYFGSLLLFCLGLLALGAVLRTRFGSGSENDASFSPPVP